MYNRIVVPRDGSAQAEKALRMRAPVFLIRAS
jgi:nucleotide-binding universal stress UspA family protein